MRRKKEEIVIQPTFFPEDPHKRVYEIIKLLMGDLTFDSYSFGFTKHYLQTILDTGNPMLAFEEGLIAALKIEFGDYDVPDNRKTLYGMIYEIAYNLCNLCNFEVKDWYRSIDTIKAELNKMVENARHNDEKRQGYECRC